VLADPQLAVYDASGAQIASNDDWGSATNVAQIVTATTQAGAFPLNSGSKDAAILATFAPGTYTMKCIGTNSTTGVALLEVYDADTNPRLVYLSLRGNAGTGSNVLIAGFVVSGTGSGQYLIRAVGASTIASAGMLGNPTLSVYSSGNTPIASNDDWGSATSAPDIAAAAQTVGAQPLVGNGQDSALLLTLNPGPYSAQVSGAGSTTGIALVEIFAVDSGRATSFAPAIVSPPIPMTVNLGQSAFFGVGAVGKPQPTYRWQKNGVAIADATNAALLISSVQASDAGDYTVVVTNSGGSATSSAATLTVPSYHSADTNQDWKLGLIELTRVIELYNTRNGTVRTGCYAVATTATEDGFTQDAARANTATVTLTRYHSADTDKDGKLSLVELTRVIELYNCRSGTSRTGQYHVQAGTEDGFAPGP
jgi:hypothetical protein